MSLNAVKENVIMAAIPAAMMKTKSVIDAKRGRKHGH